MRGHVRLLALVACVTALVALTSCGGSKSAASLGSGTAQQFHGSLAIAGAGEASVVFELSADGLSVSKASVSLKNAKISTAGATYEVSTATYSMQDVQGSVPVDDTGGFIVALEGGGEVKGTIAGTSASGTAHLVSRAGDDWGSYSWTAAPTQQ